MAASRKLSAFRQLSLDCDHQRRKPVLKKQLTEDHTFWPNRVRPSSRNLIKVAWEDDPVIVRRVSPLLRDTSTSCDPTASILAKQEVTKVSTKEPEKTNIQIYLAQDTKSTFTAYEDPYSDPVEDPKRPPLISTKDPSNPQTAPPRGRQLESNALIVIPVNEDPKTAVSKRRQFQKRTNSAFHDLTPATPTSRPPLIRSSSAPAHKSTRSKKKFLLKKVKKSQDLDEKDERELKGADVVTMVSLISPEGSEGEEEGEEKKVVEEKKEAEAVAPPKVMSLRKTVKSVSFQQSSIHAVRSFSASFPSRRASLMFGGVLKTTNKNQEKRSTHQSDEDERVPKRRLVKCQQIPTNGDETQEKPGKFHVNITAKEKTHDDDPETTQKPEEKKDDPAHQKNEESKTQKEQQCWSLYCKMTEKGINVSFDTILRGMLTPTEYRITKMHRHHQSLEDGQRNDP